MIPTIVLAATLVLAAGKHEQVGPTGLVAHSPFPGLEDPGAAVFTDAMKIGTEKLTTELGATGKGFRIDYGATITSGGLTYYFRLTGPGGEEIGRKIPA